MLFELQQILILFHQEAVRSHSNYFCLYTNQIFYKLSHEQITCILASSAVSPGDLKLSCDGKGKLLLHKVECLPEKPPPPQKKS